MKISETWLLQAQTQAVMAMLKDAGYQALAVGGCVRNALIGAPASDVDMSTNARPAQVMALAEAAGFRAIPTGIDHGTVTVVVEGIPFEITTWRRDVETDGRHAVVTFSDCIEEDAARRDFTMNALYAAADGQVIDPLGGLQDALDRRLRFIGDPAARIREDYLRILRFFRFYAWYGDAQEGFDREGFAACAELAEGLESLSRERLGTELKKLFAAPNPAPAVAGMAQAGILGRLLPGADHRGLGLLVHLEEELAASVVPSAVASWAPNWTGRMALVWQAPDPKSLRLSRVEGERLKSLASLAREEGDPAVLGHLLGADLGVDAVLLRAALLESPLPLGWQARLAEGAAARFPIEAADLMPELAGPALGARLKHLRAAWLASGLRLTKDQLLQM